MNLTDLRTMFERLRAESGKVLVGLEDPFELLVVALFSNGHVLLEGVPGTAKTLMAKTLSHMVQAQYPVRAAGGDGGAPGQPGR
jgi:MoxR-like ATPase